MAYADWEVTGGETPQASKWNQLGDNDEFLKENLEFVGVVKGWVSANDPANDNWMVCNGRAISRSNYPALFSLIGTTYGAGDGSTTFNIPDVRSRVLVGLNSGEAEFNSMGKTGGHKLLQSHNHGNTGGQSANHSHTTIGLTNGTLNSTEWALARQGGSYYNKNTGGTSNDHVHGTANSGDGNAQNLQPYIVFNQIIKVK